jgi:asparagine synthase (glutamine-hydrolysing)
MCGICGIVSPRAPSELQGALDAMVESLLHRGPDGQDAKIFQSSGLACAVGFGHARLAIIDLSDAGRQPLSNEDGTIWLIFNGEIYNFKELRAELEAKGHRFRTQTDSEVIVHLYEELGTSCPERLNGMFAFAILDLPKRRLLFARDHIGVKPLYYWSGPGGFVFGSEIKAILASGLYSPEVDWQGVHDYFTYLYTPCPATVFRGIRQLPPAHRLVYDLSGGVPKIERYWQVSRREDVERASIPALREQLRALLTDSVKRQLISDVPLGVFLSGGVDSTIVTGLARREGIPLQTFTVVFEGEEFAFYNEQEISRQVSRHLGTVHQELSVAPSDPAAMLNLVEFFDQPFGNPTAYLMYLICAQARKHITVALNGAGGDELYAGYPRYRAARLAHRLRWIPRSFLRAGSGVLDLFHDSYRTMRLRRARKFLEGLDADFPRQFVKWTYFFDEPAKAELISPHAHNGGHGPCDSSERLIRQAGEHSALAEFENRMLHADVLTFLPDNILEYTDKMGMAVALEARVPLLDYRFVEFSLNVPFAFKLKDGQSKWLLRESFPEFFPPAARTAPKRGFNAPLAHWMLHVFDDYFEPGRRPGHSQDLFGEDAGATWREGILNPAFVQELRGQHQRGLRDNSYELFSILMFDVWWRKYIKRSLPRLHAGEVRLSR